MADPVFYDGQPGPEIRRSLNEMVALWQQALEEAVGPQGWSPAFGVVADGDRRVLQIVDWVGGAGEKPSITGYIGASDIVPTIGDAIDIRGGQGIQGNQGDKGWSPEISGENHGDRRVLRVDDWVGGEGAKPGTGYIGVSGLVPNISDALDVRGGQGIKGDTGPANVLQIGTVESGETADATITGTTPTQTLNLVLPKGDDAWNPVMATVNDGDRRVIQITDWVDGVGTKPATGYLGPSGVVSTIGAATDIRGTQGIKGNTGDKAWNPVMATVADGDRRVIQITDWTGGEGTKPTAGYLGPSGIVPTIGAATDVRGAQGFKGDTGDSAWTPVYTAVADGERRVLRIDDWVDGQGTKPATGYLGVSGVVANIGDALDIRGAPGEGAVSSVNSIGPDGNGNVDLGISDIPGLEDALDNAGQVKTVAGKGPDGAGNVALETSDITGLPDALAGKLDAAQKGAANGVAPLDASGHVPAVNLPSYVDDVLEYSTLSAFPNPGETGKIYVTLNDNKTWRWGGSSYTEISASPGSTDAVPEGSSNLYFTVSRVRSAVLTGLSLATNAAITASDTVLSAFGKLQKQVTDLDAAKAPKANPTFTGTVSGVTKAHVGLGNVDNTSDANKPISTATQNALNAKAATDLSNVTQATARTKVGSGTMAYRNVTISTSEPSGGADGDVWLKV